jgi:hypothetical protein
MLKSGTDPESYITEYTLVYEDRLLYPNGWPTVGSYQIIHLWIILETSLWPRSAQLVNSEPSAPLQTVVCREAEGSGFTI